MTVERVERRVRPAGGFLRLYVEDVDGEEVYRNLVGDIVDFEAWQATGGEYIVFPEDLREGVQK